MIVLPFVTGNDLKFLAASEVCEPRGIKLKQERLDLTEIQAPDGEAVARHKAEQAYELLGQPVVVCDDSWFVPGLGGFPGPYMKYMNDWLTPENYRDLFANLTDRRISLEQVIVYQDHDGQRLFRESMPGILLTEPRGNSSFAHNSLVSFDGGKHSAAEIISQGGSSIGHHRTAWHKLAEELA